MKERMSLYRQAIEEIRSKSTGKPQIVQHDVTINFHPDRYTKEGVPLLISIAKDKRIKSQFESGTSNGGLTAFTGGDRWKWEQNVFGGIYDQSIPSQRPKYGALNYKNFEYGAAPRFGSSYFRLKPEVLERTTFCYPDSFFEPDHFASHEYMEALINLAQTDDVDDLDAYIEAQIHGELLLLNDVDAIVLDPIYKGTEVEQQAFELGVDVEWHSGYQMTVEMVAKYPDYRGKEFVELAAEIAINGKVNPRILGNAINQLGYDEQAIKKVWHYLAKYGYKSDR